MNYIRIYSEFIADRRLQELSLKRGHYDRHHILPRCLGGDKDPSNIVRLSFSDHFFAHLLLAKIHGGLLSIAFAMMSKMTKFSGKRSRKLYEILRLEANKERSKLSKAMWQRPGFRERQESSGRNNIGDRWSDAAGRAQLLAKLRSPEHRKKQSLFKDTDEIRSRKRRGQKVRRDREAIKKYEEFCRMAGWC